MSISDILLFVYIFTIFLFPLKHQVQKNTYYIYLVQQTFLVLRSVPVTYSTLCIEEMNLLAASKLLVFTSFSHTHFLLSLDFVMLVPCLLNTSNWPNYDKVTLLLSLNKSAI